jgi:diacylglycerol kinase family enzyme
MYLGAVITGQHQSWDDCVTMRTARVLIESEAQVPFQLDGDPGGMLPADIRVLPGRLNLVVARERADGQLRKS